jgi:hypothetical protein
MLIRNITDLADYVGVNAVRTHAAVEQRLQRAIYKGTDCGAWIRCWENEVVIGSIVEGSDAEFTESMTYPFESDDYDWKLDFLEEQCAYEWERCNREEEYED